MAVYNQQAVNPLALSANQCLIFIGDQVVAFAQTVTHTFDLGTQQLYGIGSSMIQEIQQLRMNPSITIDSFELTEDGNTLIEGHDSGVGLTSFIVNNSFNISIKENNANGGVGGYVYLYVGCQASNFSESIPTNQIVTKTITFSALDVLGSDGASILNPIGNVQNFAQQAGVFAVAGIIGDK